MQPIQASVDLGLLLPQILLTLGGIALLLLSLVRRSEVVAPYVALAVVVATAWACAGFWGAEQTALGGGLAVGPFTVIFDLLLLIAAGMTCLLSAAYLGSQYEMRTEYYGLLLFCTLGMTVVTAAQDFVALFVGLEVFSIALYLMVAFTRRRARSLEGALKYFLLGAFSSGFVLYGMALIFGSTRTLDIGAIGEILIQRQAGMDPILFAGIGLLVVGLGFKIGVVPFHFWIPDVYEGAPVCVTAFMSAATKVAAFAALLRVLHVAFGGDGLAIRWAPLLGLLAALTMTVANVVAVTQTNIKRLLAYSSIAHAGYLLLAVATNSIQGLESLAYYLLAYVFANLGAFSVVVLVSRSDADGEAGCRLSDYAGLGHRRPGMAAAMTVFMLSLAGIPPTAGFLGKWFIFRSALDADLLGLAIVLAVNSAIAAYYYLGVIVQMYMVEPDTDRSAPPLRVPLAISAALAVVVTFYLGLFPGRALAVVNEMALRFWGTIHQI